MNQKVFISIFIALMLVALAESARQFSRQRDRSNSKVRSKTQKTRILIQRSDVFEDLFNVYDPSFLAVVWPKIINGVHLFVEPACWNDVSVFFRDLSIGRAWAYNAVDASGRYQSGLFKGNTYWIGSKEECLQLDKRFRTRSGNDTLDEFRDGDYLTTVLRREKYFDGGAENWRSLVQGDELMRRLVLADHTPPYRVAYTALTLELNLTKITMAEAYTITLGVCLPRSCSPEDITSIINFSIMISDNLKTNKTIPRTMKINSLRQIEEHFDVNKDIGAVLLIWASVLLITIALLATAVDLKLIKCRPRNSKSMSFDLEKFNTKNVDFDNKIHNDSKHNCDVLPRKESNVLDTESLTINNINNANNINLVTVKKVMKPNVMPPSITLDVVSMERVTGSCKRCGKYKKQCNANSNNLKHTDNLPACPRVKSFASITTEPKKKDNLFKSLLLCFSLIYSWKRIFNTNMANKDLAIIHVLKIAATFWVIYIHVAMIANYVSENGGDVNDYNNLYYILTTGTLAFDVLFFVSGLFSAHHFFFLKSQYSVEELVSFGGVCGQSLQVVCFVTNRAIRLLPSYLYAIFLSSVVARSLRVTSPLTLPERDYQSCDSYWWRNILYISTMFPSQEQCMQISWYLSVETQLHIFGALSCALVASARRLVVTAAVVAVAIATAADVSAAYATYHLHFRDVYAAYGTLVARGLARVAPYCTGLLAGWLVIKLEGRLHIGKSRLWFLWVCSMVVVCVSLCSPWLVLAWFTSWLHPLAALSLLLPAMCATTVFNKHTRWVVSSGGVAALSRVCYSLLLLHGPVGRLLLLAHTPLCSHTLCIWWYYTGVCVVSLLASLLLSLFIETPCCSLLRKLSDCAS